MTTVVRQATVAIADGIHARPSHAIVSLAVDFDASVCLHFDGRVAETKSILSVMTLGAPFGSMIELRGEGVDAEQAVDAIANLI
ncbi:MAG: HPr family phosphocarrier protein, partial [Planctomycetota bacterium]|nr:HPr family phosphocarrier protein [Planctomycetota bacterium]